MAGAKPTPVELSGSYSGKKKRSAQLEPTHSNAHQYGLIEPKIDLVKVGGDLVFMDRINKDNRGLLQKLLSFRYQKPNQIPIEGTVSNPEFEPNQISEPEPDENRSSFDLREVD